MTVLFFYFIKVCICSGLLLGYYYLALRNKIFHQWNRFYLLSAVALALVLPLISFPLLQPTHASDAEVVKLLQVVASSEEVLIEAPARDGINWQAIAAIAYAVVCSFLLAMLAHGLLQLRRWMRTGHVVEAAGIRIIQSDAKGTPFSFMQHIFWNPAIDISSAAGQQILQHEIVHVREGHTWDKLAMQVALVLFWANPFFWVIRAELKSVHEFIADKKSLPGADAGALAALLLKTVYPQHYHQLSNSFFHSSIKRRLAMIKKLNTPQRSYLSRIVALPLIAVVAAAFTLKPAKEPVAFTTLEKKYTVVIDAGHGRTADGNYGGPRSANGVYEDELTLAIAKLIQSENKNPNIDIELTRTNEKELKLQYRVKRVQEAGADVFVSVHVNAEPQKLKSGFEVITSGKNFTYQSANQLLGSSLIQQMQPVYKTASQIQQRKAGIYVLDQSLCPAVIIECGYLTNDKDLKFISDNQNQIKTARAILKGIENYLAQQTTSLINNREAVSDTIPAVTFNSSEIESVNVISDSTAEIKLRNGKRAVYKSQNMRKQMGGDGILTVSPKGQQPVKKVEVQKSKANMSGPDNALDSALIFIDSEEYTQRKDLIDQMNPSTIESMRVLKGESAVALYGERGRKGVIEVKLKPNSPKVPRTSTTIDPERNRTIEAELKSNSNSPGELQVIFAKTEIEPAFPGGRDAWRNYLGQTLDATAVKKKGATKGNYSVVTQFIVNTDGSLEQIKPATNHGFGMEQQVIETLQQGPKWLPAMQNGRKVRAQHEVTVTFSIA